MKPLWKTTVVIWSEYNGELVELETLAREATSGSEAYCARYRSKLVDDPAKDEAWDGTEFFDEPGYEEG